MLEIKNAIQDVEKEIEGHLAGIENSIEFVRSYRASQIQKSKEQGTYRELLQGHADTIDYHHERLQVNLEVLAILQKYDHGEGENINVSATNR